MRLNREDDMYICLIYKVFINIVFFSKILKNSILWPFSVFHRC